MPVHVIASAPAPRRSEEWMSIRWDNHVRTTLVNGRRVNYCDYGRGPTMLLVHGLGGSWHSWLENIPAFARTSRVVAVDLPGFGESDRLPPPFQIGGFVDVLTHLLTHLDAGPTTVVAHSMGGLPAMKLASEQPGLVRRLVLANAGGVDIGAMRIALIARAFSTFKTFIGHPRVLRNVARRPHLRRAILAPAIARPWAMPPALAAEIIPRMAAPGFNDAVRAAAQQVALRERANVACPVLLAWGGRDRLLPVALARELATELSDARLEIIAEAAHCPMFEESARFNDIVLDFMRTT